MGDIRSIVTPYMYTGQGSLHVAKSSNPLEFTPIGGCGSVDISITENVLEHYTGRGLEVYPDMAHILTRAGVLSIETPQIDVGGLAMFVGGTAKVVPAAEYTKTIGIQPGVQYDLGCMSITGVTVMSIAPAEEVNSASYEVDYDQGVIHFTDDSLTGLVAVVTVTHGEYTCVDALNEVTSDVVFKIEGVNTSEHDNPVKIVLHRVKAQVLQKLQAISSTPSTQRLQSTVLANSAGKVFSIFQM